MVSKKETLAAAFLTLSLFLALGSFAACGPIDTRSEIIYDPTLFPVTFRLYDQFNDPVGNADIWVRYNYCDAEPDRMTRTTNEAGIATFPRIVGCEIRPQGIHRGGMSMGHLPATASDFGRPLSSLEQYLVPDGPFSVEVGIRVFVAPPLTDARTLDERHTAALLFNDVKWPYDWSRTILYLRSDTGRCSAMRINGVLDLYVTGTAARSLFEPPAAEVRFRSGCDGDHNMVLIMGVEGGGSVRDYAFGLSCTDDRCQVRSR